MKTQFFRSVALAAAVSLVAGGAIAQTRGGSSSSAAAANLGYSAAPLNGQGYGYRADDRPTVMGTTGAVEPGYPEATGSIARPLPGAWSVRTR